ncbi:hypothetical protein [Intestinibacter bartlettii]|uniref:hypothetical protein n=1 Tax=Intestinibacter bartlettii TaxID=261299 RepID=UPI00321C2427
MAEKSKIRLRFTDNREIRRSLNRVANMVVNGELDPQRASAIATLCNTMLKAEKQLEYEKQLEELLSIVEEIVEKKEHE